MPWSVATIFYAPPLRRNRASLSRVADTPLRQESFRFCPRVFGINRHFSQESALREAKIHALLWAYRGPRERKDAGHTYASICLQESSHTSNACLSKRSKSSDNPLLSAYMLLICCGESLLRYSSIIFDTSISHHHIWFVVSFRFPYYVYEMHPYLFSPPSAVWKGIG